MGYRFDHQELKRRRIESGKKPELVALDINRTKEAYVAYERGAAIPPTPIVLAICDSLDLEPSDLLVRVDDEDYEQIHRSMVESRQAQGLPTVLPDDEVAEAAELLRLSSTPPPSPAA